MAQAAEWIAVDWGAHRVQAWAMQGDSVSGEAQGEPGGAKVAQGGFEAALIALIGAWVGAAPLDVLLCGEGSLPEGWIASPPARVPAPPLPGPPQRLPCSDARLRLHGVAGLKQDTPADLMQGDATRIAGFLATRPHWDGVICLTGAQGRWAHASAGEVVSFQSFMTGELIELLAHRSSLSPVIGAGWDAAAFASALDDAMARPERLAAHLSGLQARSLLQGAARDAAAARLCGLLIGAELAAARPYWLGQQVVIIGDGDLPRRYGSALEHMGVAPLMLAARDMTLAGLIAARARLGPRP